MAFKSGRLTQEILEKESDILLENLRLKEGKYIKRGALLLFLKDPEYFITGSYIKIGYFQSDSDLIYQDEIHGNLFE